MYDWDLVFNATPKVNNELNNNKFESSYSMNQNLTGQDNKRTPVSRVFDALSVGNYAMANAAYHATDKDPNTGVIGGFTEGIAAGNPFGERSTYNPLVGQANDGNKVFSDVLGNLGWNPTSMPGKVARGTVGLAMDILLDPLSYVNPFSAASKIVSGTGMKVGKEVRRGLTEVEALDTIKQTYTVRGIDFKTRTPEELKQESIQLMNNYNQKISKIKTGANAGQDFTIGFNNLPFTNKIKVGDKTLDQFKVTIAKAEDLRKVGDKTVAPYYQKAMDVIKSTKKINKFDTLADLKNLHKSEPLVAAQLFKMGSLMKGFDPEYLKNEQDIMKFKQENLDNLDEDTRKRITDLIDSGQLFKIMNAQQIIAKHKANFNPAKPIPTDEVAVQDKAFQETQMKNLKKNIETLRNALSKEDVVDSVAPTKFYSKDIKERGNALFGKTIKEGNITIDTIDDNDMLKATLNTGAHDDVLHEYLKDTYLPELFKTNRPEAIDLIRKIYNPSDIAPVKIVPVYKKGFQGKYVESGKTIEEKIGLSELEIASRDLAVLDNYKYDKEQVRQFFHNNPDHIAASGIANTVDTEGQLVKGFNKNIISHEDKSKLVSEINNNIFNGEEVLNMELDENFITEIAQALNEKNITKANGIIEEAYMFNHIDQNVLRKTTKETNERFNDLKYNVDKYGINKVNVRTTKYYIGENESKRVISYEDIPDFLHELQLRSTRKLVDKDGVKVLDIQKGKITTDESKTLNIIAKDLGVDVHDLPKVAATGWFKDYDGVNKGIISGHKKRIGMDIVDNFVPPNLIGKQNNTWNGVEDLRPLETTGFEKVARGERTGHFDDVKQAEWIDNRSDFEIQMENADFEIARSKEIDNYGKSKGIKNFNQMVKDVYEKSTLEVSNHELKTLANIKLFEAGKNSYSPRGQFDSLGKSYSDEITTEQILEAFAKKNGYIKTPSVLGDKLTDKIGTGELYKSLKPWEKNRLQQHYTAINKKTFFARVGQYHTKYIQDLITKGEQTTKNLITSGLQTGKLDAKAVQQNNELIEMYKTVVNRRQQALKSGKLVDDTGNLNKFLSKQETEQELIKLQSELKERLDSYNAKYTPVDVNASLKQWKAEAYNKAAEEMGISLQELVDLMKIPEQDKAYKIAKDISSRFDSFGRAEVEHGLLSPGQFEGLKGQYVYHMLTDEGYARVMKDMFDEHNGKWNPRAMGVGVRKKMDQQRGMFKTIDQANGVYDGFGIKFFEDDIAKIFMARAIAHNDMIFGDEMTQGIREMFGKDYVKGETIPGHTPVIKHTDLKNILFGYEIAKAKKLHDVKPVEKISDETIDAILGENGAILFSPNMAFVKLDEKQMANIEAAMKWSKVKGIEDDYKVFNMRDEVIGRTNKISRIQQMQMQGDMLNLYDKYLMIYKMWNSAMMPGFHPQNFASNVFNSFLGHGITIMNPARYKQANELLSKKDFHHTYNINGVEYTKQDLHTLMQKYGVLSNTFFREDVSALGGVPGDLKRFGVSPALDPTDVNEFKPYQWSTVAGARIEGLNRVVLFIKNLEDGKGIEEAVDDVNKFLFDYGDLTDFEKNTMKRVIPFYTWMRKNTPLQLENMLNNTFKYSWIAKGSEEIENMSGEDEIDESQLNSLQQDAIQLPGQYNNAPIAINTKLPYLDLNRYGVNKMLGQTTPLIKTPLELMTGKMMYTGEDTGNLGEYLLGQNAITGTAQKYLKKQKQLEETNGFSSSPALSLTGPLTGFPVSQLYPRK